MKQRSLTALTIIFSICLLVFACRKEINNFVHDRKNVSSELLETAKVWYLQHLDTKAPKIKQYGPLPVHWNDAWTAKAADSSTILIVPAAGYNISNPNFSFKRFVAFRVAHGSVTGGRIVELLGEHYDVEASFDFLTKNYDQKTIPGYNGGVLQYDVSYRPVKSAFYENGRESNNRVRLISQKGKYKETQNLSREFGSCGYVATVYSGFPDAIGEDCIISAWEQVVYDPDGCIISDVITFISMSCPSDGSGSGSASGSGSGDGSEYPPGDGEGSQSPLGPRICINSFNFVDAVAQSHSLAKAWGIVADYPNYGISLIFGEEVFAPITISNWDLNDILTSETKYSQLWWDQDIKVVSGIYSFSNYAQKVITADATDAASLSTSAAIASGIVYNTSTYKSFFKTVFLNYVHTYMPGTTMNILNTDEPGTTQVQLTDGDPTNCH